MKKTFKRMLSTALALVMAVGFSAIGASAADRTDGDYTGKVTMLHETQSQNSMCNVLFDHDVDIAIKGENAEVRLYAAYPVPTFPDQGKDGTLTNATMTLDGTVYNAVSDIASKPVRTMDETNVAFGVEAGKALSTQVLTFTIPAAKLDSLATAPAAATAHVNVVMNADVNFRIQLNDIQAAGNPVEPPATETTEQNMQITADIAAPQATYTVTIPETVAMGTLSAENDNTTAYKVEVTAENLGKGYVEVSAPAAGALKNGENELAFANSFGAQKTSVTATLNGEFTVAAADVQAAAAGNYTGNANFTIRYFAGK